MWLSRKLLDAIHDTGVGQGCGNLYSKREVAWRKEVAEGSSSSHSTQEAERGGGSGGTRVQPGSCPQGPPPTSPHLLSVHSAMNSQMGESADGHSTAMMELHSKSSTSEFMRLCGGHFRSKP